MFHLVQKTASYLLFGENFQQPYGGKDKYSLRSEITRYPPVGKNVDIPEKNPKNSIAAEAKPRESATTTSSTVPSEEDGEVEQISTDVCL